MLAEDWPACLLISYNTLQRSLRLVIGESREIEVLSGEFKEPGRDITKASLRAA